jgi:CHAD domain-containing protein
MQSPDEPNGPRAPERTRDVEEVEWQLDAPNPRAVRRWLRAAPFAPALALDPAGIQSLDDTYYDTEDWRLYRAGCALRVRRVGDRVEATMKSRVTVASGPERRREITAAIEDGGRAAREGAAPGLDLVAGPLATRIALIAGRHPLVPVAALHTRRERFALRCGATAIAEVAIDRTKARARSAAMPTQLDRVEVELRGPASEEVTAFVEALRAACGLERSAHSKYEAALAAAGVIPAAVPDVGPTTIDDGMTVGAVAYAVLRRGFIALLRAEPGTRIGEDVEALHDMRVAIRRLRTAMRLFADVLPRRAAGLRAALGWLGTALGAVRDLDVQLEQVRSWRAEMGFAAGEPVEGVAAVMRRRRLVARDRMLRALDSRRYDRFVTRFAELLRRESTRGVAGARRPVLAAAPELIERRVRKLEKAADRLDATSPAPDYHAARIQTKRLRYALEAHGEVYGKPLRALLRAVVALQDLLGEHQDAAVAAEHLRALCASRGTVARRETVFVIGGIAERYAAQAARLRSKFPKRYRRVRGRRWKRLKRAMEARLPVTRPRARGGSAAARRPGAGARAAGVETGSGRPVATRRVRAPREEGA